MKSYDILQNNIYDLGSFAYRANGGNLGDFLISSSEFRIFEEIGAKYKLITSKNKNNIISNRFNLVYGGGGGWVRYYKKDYQYPIKDYFKNRNLNRCIVLPSSFYDCDDVVTSFDNRFLVFCRDYRSFEYCKRLNSTAKFVFYDDLAFRLDAKCFLKSDYFLTKKEGSIAWSFDKVLKYIHSNTGKEASFIREDAEKSIEPLKGNFDISAYFYRHGENISREDSDSAAELLLNTVNRYDVIHTNRLHVAIASILLGKKVNIYDNSYGKISAVMNRYVSTHDNKMININF